MNFHGGNIYDYKTELLDFSSNINPLGVPLSFKQKLSQCWDEFTKYPDIEYRELRWSIAEYLGVNGIEYIIPSNGAVELIYKYMSWASMRGCKKMLCLAPTFSEYSRAARLANIEVHELDAFSDNYSSVDIEKILACANNYTVVVICNPNNPTGTLIKKESLEYLAEGLNLRGSKLVIDEAFIEFTMEYPRTSMLDVISKYDNLMLVRALTKFFGMPGIRLGYGVSSNIDLIKGIKNLLEPWNINTAASIAGSIVLRDDEYIKKTKEWIASEYIYLNNQLNQINGIKCYKSSANFQLIELTHKVHNVWKLRDWLITKGILIRTPEGFKGLNQYNARLAVKDRASNDRLLEILNDLAVEKFVEKDI